MPGAPGGRVRRSIGYVPQKVLLDPDVPLRARDLVALGIDGNRFGFRLPSRERRPRSTRCWRPWAPSASPTPGWARSRAVSCSGC